MVPMFLTILVDPEEDESTAIVVSMIVNEPTEKLEQ